MIICKRIFVNGVVQGVGYRFFAYRKAVEYGLKGYAKNLYSGEVEIVAEGEEKMVTDFIRDLNIGPQRAHVTSITAEELPCDNQYDEFQIL